MPTPAPGADLAACRSLLRHGSRTFFAASLLLPSWIRAPAGGLYAFCRAADDQIDLDGCAGGPDPVGDLRRRLAAIYAGAPGPLLPDRALCEVVGGFAIPQALPLALVEGFAWDREGRQYASIHDLRAYAARVAGSVGAMMALLMGVREPQALARACDLGTAMQLTNIARDVGEDARAGRLYLPRDWMRDAGIDPDRWLAAPAFSPALGEVVDRVLNEADRLYERAGPGIAALPADCRPAIQAARLMYRAIGHRVRATGLDSVNRRAVVPVGRKLVLAVHAVTAAATQRPDPQNLARPVLPESRFLVDAVAVATPAAPTSVTARAAGWGWRGLDARVGRMLELMQRLKEQEQTRRQFENP